MRIISNSLKCSSMLNPLSAEAESIYFGYKLQSDISGDKQIAYRIIISNNIVSLNKDNGNIWDSGKVVSEESVNIEYLGRKLENGSAYYWKVQVWDINGEKSQWSEPAFFRTSIDEKDWQGKWISIADIPVMMMGENAETQHAPQLRRKFSVKKHISEAYLQICGLGYYDLWINGDKAGDIVLDPAPTKFDETVLYQTYDVKNLLAQGDNAIGVMLGNGWYNCFTKDAWCYDKASWRGYPRMLMQLDIVYMDGEKETIVSDNTWKASTGPITFNGVRNGETYDARLEKAGWNEAVYDDTDWDNAVIVTSPGGRLKPQNIPPIRKISTLSPISVAEVKPKVWVYDFGKNISGWAHIKMKGNPGDELTIKYSERINHDVSINRENISRLIFNYDFQTDRYIFKGTGVEEWEPRFTHITDFSILK